MKQKSINQKGFAALEAVLVLVIVAIIGGTGYYVYQAYNKSTDTQNSAQTNANTAAPHKKDDKKPAVQYTTISEWNVRAPIVGSLKLQYSMSDDGKQANFTSEQLVALDPECDEQSGGQINRYAPNDVATADGAAGQTAKERAAKADKSTYAYVGGYYYFFAHSQSGCGADTGKTVSLQQQTNNAVKALVPKLKEVPASD